MPKSNLSPIRVENKFLGGAVLEVKVEQRNGVDVGIVEGYIATWDIDRGDFFGIKDQFLPGAFADSIAEHRKRDHRQIRLMDHHGRTIGGFPIESVKEDARGLFGRGEINLEVQQGREAFALAKQKVLVDFSIGFSIDDSDTDRTLGLRTINKATIWEGSIVDEPMNPFANITVVKNLNKDGELSEEALALFRNSDLDQINAAVDIYMKQREADDAEADPENDLEPEKKDHMDMDGFKNMTTRELENALTNGTKFSKQLARKMAAQMNIEEEAPPAEPEPEAEKEFDWNAVIAEIKSTQAH